MTRQTPLSVVALAGLMLALAGCEQPSVTPEGTSQTTVSPATPTGSTPPTVSPTAPTAAPLPAAATLKLDQLQPPVAKPASAETPKPLSPRTSEALADAEKALAANDLTKAIDTLDRAAGFDPTNPKVRRALAMAYFARQDYGKALESLRIAIKTTPDDLESQLMLGRLLAAQRRDADAIVAFRTALLTTQATPENPLAAEALYRLATLLQENGYATASLEAYDTLAQWLDKHGRNYAGRQLLRDLVLRPEKLQTVRGHLLMQLRRPAEAVGPLEKSFETNRTDMSTARLLLEALIATKQSSRAEKLLVELTNESAQAAQLSMLAEVLCRSAGDPDMPVRIWNTFLKKNQINPGLAIALAKISERLGKPDRARTILGSVLQAMPANVQTANALAGVIAREKKYTEALDVLTGLVRQDPTKASQIEEGIRQIIAAGANASTVAALMSAKASQPATGQAGDFASLYVAGQLAEALGLPEAMKAYADSAAANKDFLPAFEAEVDLALSGNQKDAAQKVVDSLPKGYFADYLNAKIKLQANKAAEAIKDLESSRKANAKFVPAALLLADAYIRQQQTDNAIIEIFAALETEPDNAQAYRKLFEVYIAGRQYNDAQMVIGRFLERQPQNLQGLIMLAELNLANNQRPTALHIIAQLLDQAPESPEVNMLAARAELTAAPGLVAKPQFDKAVGYLDAALKLDPRNLEVLRLKADLLAQPGRFDQVAEVWKRIYAVSGRDENGRNYAAALMLAGRYDQAVAVLETISSRSPDIAARQALVESLTHQEGGWQKAADLLLKWLKEDTEKDKLHVAWYRARLMKLADDATAKKPGSVRLDDVQKVLDDWITTADPNTKDALQRQKVRLYVLGARYDQAEQAAAGATGDDEAKALAVQSLAASLIVAKQFDRAHAVLDKAIESAKTPELKDRLRGVKIDAFVDGGKIDAAEKYAAAWIAQEPKSKTPQLMLIETLMMAKQYDRALKLVESYLAAIPRPTTAAVKPATPATSMADIDLGEFLRANQVRLMVLKERYADALKLAEEYLKFAPDSTEILNLKSTALTELGRHDESIQALEKVLSLKPDDAGANNNLAYMYIERGVQLEKAERMLRKALAERPNEPSFMDSLGWAMYRQGRVHEAASVLREVVLSGDEDAEHPVIFDHAGDAYWRLGWNEEAVKFWNKSLELVKKETLQTTEMKQVARNAAAKVKAAGQKKAPELAPFAPPPASKPATSTSAPTSAAMSQAAK